MTTDALRDELIDRFERTDTRVERIETRIDALRDEMINRFEGTDARVEGTDARVERTEARIERTEATIAALRDEMINRFEKIDAALHRADGEFATVRAEMKAEHDTTRRHFDIVAEKMGESVKIVAEATAHHTLRIDDHDKRLKRLERPRRS